MKTEAVPDVPMDTGNFRHGDDASNGQEAPPGIARSIQPGVPCPETVLAAVMSDGSYLLLGYPQGEPAVFVAREDADLLRRALAGAFGSPTGETDGENGNSNGTVVPGNRAQHPQQVNP